MAIILQTVDRPELQDDHLENSRKVPLDRHDIIIDKVRIFNLNVFIFSGPETRYTCPKMMLQKRCE